MRPLLILIFYFFYSSIFAQTGSIRGFVYDKKTGEPVIYCNTYLEGTNLGSPTDLNGLYNISKVPNGNYKIVISYIGYDTLKVLTSGIGNVAISLAISSLSNNIRSSLLPPPLAITIAFRFNLFLVNLLKIVYKVLVLKR